MALTEQQRKFLADKGVSSTSTSASRPKEELLLTTKDGGRVVAVGGRRYFTSPGYSTSDPAKINAIIAQEAKSGNTPRQMAESDIRQDIIGQAPGVARATKVMQGVPFIGEGMDEAVTAMSPTAGRRMRSLQGAMEQENPVESTLLRMAGGVTGAPLEGAAAATVLGSMARGGAMGAAEGLTSGYLAGEGDNRGQQALQAGAMGSVFGAGGKAIGDSFGRGVESFLDKSPRAIADELGLSLPAARVIRAVFEGGGSAEDAVARIRMAGQQGMIADASADVQIFLDGIMRLSPAASREAGDAIGRRLQTSSREVEQSLDQGFGASPQGSGSALRELEQRSAPARGRLYDVAYGKTIDYEGPEGQAILDQLDRVPENIKSDAISRANEILQMDRNTPDVPVINVSIGPDGKMGFEEMPSVRQLDAIKRSLQEVGVEMRNRGEVERGSRYLRAGRDVRDTTSAAVPIYGRAVEAGGDNIAEREIFGAAENILNPRMTREAFADALSGATDYEMRAARIGARNAIDDILANARRGLNGNTNEMQEARNLITMASSRSAQEKLRLLLPRDQAEDFFRKMEELRMSFMLRSNTSQGSQTAARLGVRDMMQDVLEPGLTTTLQRGEPLNATKAIIQKIAGTSDADLTAANREVLREAASFLTGRRNRTAEEAVKVIYKALDEKQITPAQAKIVEAAVNVFVTAEREAAGGTGEQ